LPSITDHLIRIRGEGRYVDEAGNFRSTPASVITAPAQEWPTRITGPFLQGKRAMVAATSIGNEVRDFARR